MTELVLSPTHSSRRLVLAVLCAAGLAVASTLALVSLLGGHGHSASAQAHVYTAPGRAFAIAYPSGWQAFSGGQLRGVQGSPALVLRSGDRRAMIVVRQAGAQPNETLAKLASQLTADLKKRFSDFRPVSARLARTRGGAAFLYTFARAKAGLVQSIMVTRVRGRAYALYAISPAAVPALARQAGLVLSTFGG